MENETFLKKEIKELEINLDISKFICDSVADHSHISYFVLNCEYQIIYVYFGDTVKMLGFNKEKLLGKTPLELVKSQDSKRLESFLKENKKESQIIVNFKTKKGNFIPLEVKATIYKGEIEKPKQRTIMTIKFVENKILQEHPPADIQQIFKNAYEQAVLYKNLFSHDINNILNNIKTSASLCMMELEEKGNISNIKEYCALVIEQVARGVKLVQNVHNLSLVDQKGILVESIKLCEILKEAKNYIEHSYQTRNININFINIQESEYEVLGNPLLLDVFENLFTNSVKYNDKPVVKIWIQVSEISNNGEKFIQVDVSDNSIGIEDKKKRELFLQKSALLKKREGLGLGLSLVNKIIEKYGGKISVKNRVKSDYTLGSKFVVLLKKA